MNKYSVDYEQLGQSMSKRKVYRFADVKDHLVKVAFDIVRFRDSDSIDGLWQIQSTDDGEVIVAMYEDEKNDLEVKSHWAAVADKTGSTINVFYKNEPITKFAASTMGIPVEDVSLIVESLPEKLETNENLRNALLNQLDTEERANLTTKYPELK